MAQDFSTLSSATNYLTLLTQISDRDAALALALDPATSTPTNILTNSVRYSSANKRWEKYNGTSWGELVAAATDAFAMTVTGLRGGTLYGTTTNSGTLNAGTLNSTGGALNGSIGGTTPSTGAFTTLSASGTSNLAAVTATSFSGPINGAIGGTTPAAGAFTTLSASGASTLAGVSATTLSASSTVSGAGFSSYLASPPAIGGTAPAAGAFTTLSATGAITTAVDFKTTGSQFIYSDMGGSGTVRAGILLDGTNQKLVAYTGNTIRGQWDAAGLNAVAIGATTPSTGAFTTLSATGQINTNAALFGVSGTQDMFAVAGQAAGSGPLVTSQNYNATAYAPLTITGSSFVWKFAGGTSVLYATSTGLSVTGALSATGATTSAGFVVSNGASIVANNTDNTNYYYLQNSGATGAGNPVLDFVQGGVGTRLKLDSAGNLGVGLVPGGGYRVEVGGAVMVKPTDAAGIQVGMTFYDQGGGAGEGIILQWASASRADMARIWAVGNSTAGGDLVFGTNSANTGSASERLRITPSVISASLDVQVNGNVLRWDQSSTRSWSVGASGGNLNFASGDGLGIFSFGAQVAVNKRAYTTSTSVAFSATPSFDASASNFHILGALTANVTSVTINNAQEGQFLTIRFTQDGTGGRTITTGNMGATNAPSISGAPSTAASKASYLNITYNATAARWEGSWLGTT